MQFQEKSIPTPWTVIGISWGDVGGGGGVKQKKTFRRGVWIFFGTAQWAKDHLPLERELENCEPSNCCFQYFEKNNILECSSFVQAKRKQKCRKPIKVDMLNCYTVRLQNFIFVF